MDPIFDLGGRPTSLAELLIAGAGLAAAILLIVLLVAWRRAAARAERGREVEGRMADLIRSQSEMNGRMQTMAEVFGTRQSDLVRGLSERLDGLGHRIGQSMTETGRATHENLTKLAERLAVIDKAQQTITTLSSQVVELQHILANKQTRGAFGQGRMEAIIQDGLPSSAYQFQATLKNGTRPDCLIILPNGTPGLVIDAKFPLEAWNAIRAAATPEAAKGAEAQFRRDTQKHVDDIAARYLVPGETQDTAFMFVPSESIFADIHEHFEDVVQKAHRARIVIVSPSLLMLSVQVVMSLLRDAQMREQAHVIQKEVTLLLTDVDRLDERVRKLQAHFGQANSDIDQILTSTKKISARAGKIDQMDFSESEPAAAAAIARRPADDELPELPFRRLAD